MQTRLGIGNCPVAMKMGIEINFFSLIDKTWENLRHGKLKMAHGKHNKALKLQSMGKCLTSNVFNNTERNQKSIML